MLFRLEYCQRLPISIDRAWEFLSSPKNLKDITPPEMGFEITTPSPKKMYPGLIIGYRISPMFGIKIPWVTEITHVEEGRYFVDEQRYGPYRFWHHQHWLNEVEGGVEMTDILHYALWAPPVDRIINALMVEPKIKQIFQYRERVLASWNWD